MPESESLDSWDRGVAMVIDDWDVNNYQVTRADPDLRGQTLLDTVMKIQKANRLLNDYLLNSDWAGRPVNWWRDVKNTK